MLETSNTTEEAVDDTECENREIHTLKQVSPEPIKKNFQKKFNFFKKFSKKQIFFFYYHYCFYSSRNFTYCHKGHIACSKT